MANRQTPVLSRLIDLTPSPYHNTIFCYGVTI